MIELPETSTLLTEERGGVVHVTLNRPERKNALSVQMIEDLLAVFGALGSLPELRAVVLRGQGGTFCAGADLKDAPSARGDAQADSGIAPALRGGTMADGGIAPALRGGTMADPKQASARANRRFGDVLRLVSAVPAPVVVVAEGSVMGGGFGLVCVSDVALALANARFGLPETGLGLIPAQIAPFVLQRVGLTEARRLMLTGARFDGAEAARLGLVHEVHADLAGLEAALARTLAQIKRCAPRANAATKRLVLGALGRERELPAVLDEAAQVFAEAQIGDEAREGTRAFVEKRVPSWAETADPNPKR